MFETPQPPQTFEMGRSVGNVELVVNHVVPSRCPSIILAVEQSARYSKIFILSTLSSDRFTTSYFRIPTNFDQGGHPVPSN